MARPLVYTTKGHNALMQPIVVTDSTVLINGLLPDFDGEFQEHLSALPTESDFVIVFFASGAPKTPQITWLRKAHAYLDRALKKRIQQVYVVHAKWYTKALNKALAPIVSPKFARKITFVNNLTELGHVMDITSFDINPEVFLQDMSRNESAELGAINIPKQCPRVFGTTLPSEPIQYWQAALTYLNRAELNEETFQPISRSSDISIALVSVLSYAVRREQQLRLYDYGTFVVLAVLKEYMISLKTPLISIDSLSYPLEYSDEYVNRVMSRTTDSEREHISSLVQFCQHAQKSVDTLIIAKSLGPVLLGLRSPNRQDFAVSVRLLKTLMDLWTPISSIPTPLAPRPSRTRDESQEKSEVKSQRLRVVPRGEPKVKVRGEAREEAQEEAPVQGEPRLKDMSTMAISASAYSENQPLKILHSIPSRQPVASPTKKFESMRLWEKEDLINYDVPPSDRPSEIDEELECKPRVPNRKAFGKVLKLMQIYEETLY